MAVATVTTEPLDRQLPMPFHPPLPPRRRRSDCPRPPPRVVGLHNRRLKAMRLAIALLDSGVYQPSSAGNHRIRITAERLGIHPPSDTTCRMVRALIRYGR